MYRKALVVEDDPNTRRLLAKLIGSQDCQVDEAGDGLKAIEMLSKTDYDLVLLDIVLPKLSGTAVMDHLFLTNPAMLERVIVVTGLNVEDIRKLFPTVCHALSKPVIPNRLMDSIHKCLESRYTQSSHIA
jgi:two-component system, NtrC family, nitrogen regulation response regulator NtrX